MKGFFGKILLVLSQLKNNMDFSFQTFDIKATPDRNAKNVCPDICCTCDKVH